MEICADPNCPNKQQVEAELDRAKARLQAAIRDERGILE